MLILVIIFGIYLISSEHLFFHIYLIFHDGGRYHIETSPLICSVNQWTDFSMITASVMKELNLYMFIYQPLIARKYFPNI